jgi:hypothetical protein
LLAIHFIGDPLVRTLELEPPTEIEELKARVERLVSHDVYRSVSAVMLIWDDVFERDSQTEPGIFHRVRSSGTVLIAHPSCSMPLHTELPNDIGGTIHMELVKPLALPFWSACQGQFSMRNRVRPN